MSTSFANEEHDLNSRAALQADVLGKVTKMNIRRYGSTGTVSTQSYSASSSSSSSSQESSTNANRNKYHHLSLDLASIDNSYSSEDGTFLPGHSRESSFIDIFNDGGGYYDLFERHRQRSRDACYLLFNRNNFKVVLSFLLWFISYMIMGILGGSVAYLHFERSDRDVPEPLPDFGYDAIPVSKYLVTCLL